MLGLSCMEGRWLFWGSVGGILGVEPAGTCPKTASRARGAAYHACHVPARAAPEPRRLLPGAEGARRALRRQLLHGRDEHRHLLPPRLPRAGAAARELPLLRAGGAGRERGLSPLPALPARAGAAGTALV